MRSIGADKIGGGHDEEGGRLTKVGNWIMGANNSLILLPKEARVVGKPMAKRTCSFRVGNRMLDSLKQKRMNS